jgi:hypothetical protein
MTMNIIWSIISVFGLVTLLLFGVGIWTYLDLRKQQQKDDAAARKPEPKT